MRALLVFALCLVVRGALVTPLVTWGDEARLGIYLYHGNDERVLVTRLAFAAPLTALLVPHNASGALAVLPHPPLALRYSETVLASVSAAPLARMARTRIATHSTADAVSAVVTDNPATLLPDWTLEARWRAALFLDAHSDAWRAYACWTLADLRGAFPMLALETAAECTGRARADVAWSVQPYEYSLPRDAVAQRHGRRAGVLLLGAARLAAPALTPAARAAALGCRPPRCPAARVGALAAQWRADAAYPVVLDLESPRNYLPAGLHFLCANASLGTAHLELVFMDSTAPENARLACARGYALNADSQEIVLGAPFALANYSRLTYDARARRVYAVFAPPEAPEGLRVLVSGLILVLHALGIVWLAARAHYATMYIVAHALGSGAAQLPFHAAHAGLELASITLASVTGGIAAPYVPETFAAYFWLVAGTGAAHAVVSLVILGTTAREVLDAARPRAPHATALFGAPLVFARHAVHMVVLSAGLLLGLLLSADSLFMIGVAAFVAALAVYHLAYYTAAALICTGGLRGAARVEFAAGPWGAFVVFAGATLLVLAAGTHALLLAPVLHGGNGFYPPTLLDMLFGLVVGLLVTLGAARAASDVFEASAELRAQTRA